MSAQGVTFPQIPCRVVDGRAPRDYPDDPRPDPAITRKGRVFPGAEVPSTLLSSALLLAQNVPPKAGTPGVAADPAAPGGGGSPAAPGPGSPLGGFMPLLMMLVIFVPFFLLMSRRQKKEQAARSSLKKGDKVMGNSGLLGELVEMDDKIAKVKIAPGVTVQMLANTVSPLVQPQTATDKELKEAKAVSDKK